jgi:hypothetical protein
MCPVTGLGTHAADPVNPSVAAPALEQDVPELSLKFALRLKESPSAAAWPPDQAGLVLRIDGVGLLNKAVGVPRPVGDGAKRGDAEAPRWKQFGGPPCGGLPTRHPSHPGSD